jgi:internalin A
LQRLDLHFNKLTSLPPEIGRLTSLQRLDLGGNELTSLPPEIGLLTSLQDLDLWDNRLTSLPPEIGLLTSLQRLALGSNRLTSLPPEIGLLTSLQDLALGSNRLTNLPPEIGLLTSLQDLALWSNELTNLPPEIGQLTSLQDLDLGRNELTNLPPEIGQLTSLQRLDLGDNEKLTSLPPEIGRLTRLRELELVEDEMVDEYGDVKGHLPRYLRIPPPEIVDGGTEAILAYLRELDKAQVERYEAKLMIVGEERMGKSSLVRALQGLRFDPSQSPTEGIDIATLQLAHPTLTDKHITLHMWDLGGQLIYQATHQFFFTRRSLYLLAWNVGVTEEVARLSFWLATITALAPDARVLLVATHLDQWHGSLDDIRQRATIRAYQQRYPKIVAVGGVSNKDGTGLTQLKQHITEAAAQTELVHTPWPLSWVKAEEALLARPEHHLDLRTFLQICREQDIQEDDARNVFGPFLHDLGKLLYFHDDPDLLNLIVLKPNWITKAISRVLLNKKVRDAGGVLDKADMASIWARKEQGVSYDPALYPTFLRMMERFKLCYPIRSAHPDMPSSQYLVPLLLPEHPPEGLPEPPAVSQLAFPRLELWYRFGMVPAGLMSWLIVDTHRYSQRQHWRTGMCLADGEQQARVELLPGTSDIRLEVWGSAPHAFFFTLKGILDGLLTGKTEAQREIPCICSVCQQRLHPHLYDYDALEQHLREGNTETICPASQVSLPLLTLLYGLQPGTPKLTQVQLQHLLPSLAVPIENIQDALNRLAQGQSIIGQTVIQTQRDMTRVRKGETMAQLSQDQKLVKRLKRRFTLYPSHDWDEKYNEQGGLLHLNLSKLELAQLPPELWQFTSLQWLNLYDNQLSSLPAELCQLTNLETLVLNKNQLSSLPAELGQLTNLEHLELDENPQLQIPPLEVVEQGTTAVLAYLRALLQAKKLLPLKIFYCYAHEDRALRDNIDKHLSGLKRRGRVVVWYDREILAGMEWEREIERRLSTSQIILLLVSADFMSSDYCYGKEMQKALEMHEKGEARVLPILLRPVDWRDTPFARLQILPTGALPITRWSDRDEALTDVATQIGAVVTALLTRQS